MFYDPWYLQPHLSLLLLHFQWSWARQLLLIIYGDSWIELSSINPSSALFSFLICLVAFPVTALKSRVLHILCQVDTLPQCDTPPALFVLLLWGTVSLRCLDGPALLQLHAFNSWDSMNLSPSCLSLWVAEITGVYHQAWVCSGFVLSPVLKLPIPLPLGSMVKPPASRQEAILSHESAKPFAPSYLYLYFFFYLFLLTISASPTFPETVSWAQDHILFPTDF